MTDDMRMDDPSANDLSMSGHSAGEPSMGGSWPIWKLALMFYVFAAAAVAINLFMLGLMLQAVGFGALSPVTALMLAGPLGIPAAWAAGRWVRRLLDEAR